MTTEAKDRTSVRALSQGINLSAIKESVSELEALCAQKLGAAEAFTDAIKMASIKSGILPGVLSQYIAARVTDTVKKKSRSAEQLSFLFGEDIA